MEHVIRFFGPITPRSIGNLSEIVFQAISVNGTTHLKILFSSEGGDLSSGFAAYHFLRSLPIPVTMHNFGTVESIAAIVYLAADERLIVPHGRVLLHNFNWTFNAGCVDHNRLSEHQMSLDFDLNRYAAIFDERTHGADKPIEIRECLTGSALILDATATVTAGIASRVVPAEGAVIAQATKWWVSVV